MKSSTKDSRRVRVCNPRASKIPRGLSLMPERSIFEVNSNYNATQVGGVLGISDIAQGVGYNQRKGALIHPRRLEIRFLIENLGSAQDVRLILGQLMYDEATLSATNFVNPLGGAAWNIVAPYNRDYVGQSQSDRRLRIIRDEIFHVSNTWKTSQHWFFTVSESEMDLIRYLDSNASNQPIKGALVMYSAGSTVANGPTLQWYARLEFTDA
jgi:hypothetical protein